MKYSQVFHMTLPSEDLCKFIRNMPKVEIHVHLEGATSPELLFKMAERNHVNLPVKTVEEWKTYYAFQDFNHFIEVYMLTVSCMQKPLDFQEMVVDFMRRQAESRIQYCELFFSSSLHIHRLPGDEILPALKDGIRLGREKYDVNLALIPDISRETCRNTAAQRDVLDFALKAREMGIGIGLGIGGKEIGFPSELYCDTFKEAARQGLHVVAHAGETGDPAFIREVLDVLHPERIGHGVHSVLDPQLMQRLHESQIPLEVSPQSNYCTRVINVEKAHPLRQMVDTGLFCTVNTDDPCMFATDLENEYLTLAAQGFSLGELWNLNLNGLQATFLSEDQKGRMSFAWQNWFKDNRPDFDQVISAE